MYKIVFTRRAKKEYIYLAKSDKSTFRRISTALKGLAKNPTQGKPLKFTLKGKWSYRVGMYRIIYSIEHHILTVHILDIGHRRDIYK